MKIIFAVLFIFLNSYANARVRGTEGVGGGDPLAIEFVKIGDSISEFLSSTNMFPEIEREDFKSILKTIRTSLDDGKNQPRIRFQKEEVFCAGTPKIGCVNADQTVSIQRAAWKSLDHREKLELVVLEVLQLLNHTGRYSIAQTIGSFENEIKQGQHKLQNLTCMTIAIERSLQKSRKEYPNFLAMVPTKAIYSGNEEINGQTYNKYQVSVQVTTSDDYSEDQIFEYNFLNKNCIH